MDRFFLFLLILLSSCHFSNAQQTWVKIKMVSRFAGVQDRYRMNVKINGVDYAMCLGGEQGGENFTEGNQMEFFLNDPSPFPIYVQGYRKRCMADNTTNGDDCLHKSDCYCGLDMGLWHCSGKDDEDMDEITEKISLSAYPRATIIPFTVKTPKNLYEVRFEMTYLVSISNEPIVISNPNPTLPDSLKNINSDILCGGEPINLTIGDSNSKEVYRWEENTNGESRELQMYPYCHCISKECNGQPPFLSSGECPTGYLKLMLPDPNEDPLIWKTIPQNKASISITPDPPLNGFSIKKYRVYLVAGTNLLAPSVSPPYFVYPPRPSSADIDILNVICHRAESGKIIINNVAGGSDTLFISVKGITKTGREIVLNYPDLKNISGYQRTFPITFPDVAVDKSGIGEGLPAGKYVISIENVVRGKKLCGYTKEVEITEPEELALQSKMNHLTCHQSNDGTIEVWATGGVPPYQFSIDNGNTFSVTDIAPETSGKISNLAAGNYQILVKDANGCTQVSESITISEPSPLTANIASTDINCYNAHTGIIQFTEVGGGKGDYLFSVDGHNFQPETKFENLNAGIYSCIVADRKNCQITIEKQLFQPPAALSGSVSSTSPTLCAGSSEGSISISVAGGTFPYHYQINDFASQTDSVFSRLVSGNYTIRITDSKGCTTETNGTVSQPDSLKINYFIKDISCYGEVNGTLAADLSGGTKPYTLSLSNTIFPDHDVNIDNTGKFSNLESGNYDLLLKDFNGCTYTVEDVTVKEPTVLSSTYQAMDVLCFGDTSGSIEFTDTRGGSGKYKFSINGTLFQNTPYFGNLGEGLYYCSIVDENNCKWTQQIRIKQPATNINLRIKFIKPATCAGYNDGALAFGASGGVAPYTFQFNDGVFKTDSSYNRVFAGNYIVKVQDKSGCVAAKEVQVSEPELLKAEFNITPIKCFGEKNGAMTAIIKGGTRPYQYAWKGMNDFDSAIVNLESNVYEIDIKDRNNCMLKANAEVKGPAKPVKSISKILTTSTCATLCNGKAEVSVSGGTAPYQYTWSNFNKTSDSVASKLCSGIYHVDIRDSQGCKDSLKVVMMDSLHFNTTTKVIKKTSCGSACDGIAAVTISGGVQPYIYQWNDRNSSRDSIARGLCNGFYKISIKDRLGCKDTVEVQVMDSTTLSAVPKFSYGTACNTACNGTGGIAISGGKIPYEIEWDDQNKTKDSIARNLCTGVYIVSVSDGWGCTAKSKVVIADSSTLKTSLAFTTKTTCETACNGSAGILVSGGFKPYQYQWDDKDKTKDSIAKGLCKGLFSLKVTDKFGCTATHKVEIKDTISIQSIASLLNKTSCLEACDGSALVTAWGGTKPYRFEWNDKTKTSDSIANNLCKGNYSVKVEDHWGCESTSFIEIPDTSRLIAPLFPDSIVICPGQEYLAHAGDREGDYSWLFNGKIYSQENEVKLTQAGTYQLNIQDKAGCRLTKQFEVRVSKDVFKAKFVLPSFSSLGNTVSFVDVSWPAPDAIKWNFGTSDLTIIDSSIHIPVLSYHKEGTYTVQMKASLGECIDSLQKNITFYVPHVDYDDTLQLGFNKIKKCVLYPNPNSGTFNVNVVLEEPEDISFKIVNPLGLVKHEQEVRGKSDYDEEFTVESLTAGAYVIKVVAKSEVKVIPFVIN